MAQYKSLIERKIRLTISELEARHDQEKVTLAGIITALRRSVTKRGQTMAYFVLEDLTGSIDALLFPSNFLKFNNLLDNDLPVLVTGRLNFQEETPKIMVDNLKLLDSLVDESEHDRISDTKTKKIFLKSPVDLNEQEFWEKISPVLARYRGDTPLYLYFPQRREND